MVSKTVRLPEELVAYIESMPGDNFTSKLVGLLYNLQIGVDDCVNHITYLDKSIREKQLLLCDLSDVVSSGRRIEELYLEIIDIMNARIARYGVTDS